MCRVCGTNTDKESVLIGVYGTQKGNNMEAECVHMDCIELLYYPEINAFAQKL